MLMWIFVILDVFFSIAIGLHMGATPAGVALFGGIALIVTLLVSTIVMLFLSLLLGRNVQKVPKKILLQEIVKIEGNWYYTEDGQYHKNTVTEVADNVSSEPFIEIIKYRAGGWRGFWLWELYNYNDEYIVHFPIDKMSYLPF